MNYIKLGLISFCLIAVFSVFSAKSVEAAETCTRTWNGVSYSYNYSSSGSTGRFFFRNWSGTGYNIAIDTIGTATRCFNQAEFDGMMNWLYVNDAGSFWATGLSSWAPPMLSCGNTHTYSRAVTPVCGSAAGGSYSNPPSSNLCSAGNANTPQEYAEYPGKWRWSCTSGIDVLWCDANKVTAVAPICGSANGGTYSSVPTTGLCDSGSVSGMTTNSSSYNWNCVGQNDSGSVSCSANRNINETDDSNESSDGSGTPLALSASCVISNTVPNVGETITYSANPVGGNGLYSYNWGGGPLGDQRTAQLTESGPKVVKATLSVTSDGKTVAPICAPVEFTVRPIVKLDPPITNDTCELSWESNGLPAEAICKVYEDGIEKVGAVSGAPVTAGKKYQVKCTYTPAGIDAVETTTVSEIRACVKNPSLIEI